MRVSAGPAMARHMLDTACNAATRQAVQNAAPNRSDLLRIAAQSAIAYHVMRLSLSNIERGMVVDCNPHGCELQRHRLGACPGRLDRTGRGQSVEFVERFACRIISPVWGPQASDPATFLVD